MADKVLLYGATGFSGRLVAREAARRYATAAAPRYELVLGGRDGERLAALAGELGLRTRVFALDDPAAIDAALGDGVAVVINAAGPFAYTALPLAKGAVRSRCHYVDLNGEADVYRRLDDFGYIAGARGVALVSGAAHSATTSDLMLELALRRLADEAQGAVDIGTVRIVFSHVKYVSQGSAQTAWRSVRDQVTVMREQPTSDGKSRTLVATHEPSGRIERTFDFGDRLARRREDVGRTGNLRIATAANLLDLYTARLTCGRLIDAKVASRVRRIEAYLEMPEGARVFTQLGAASATVLAWPAVRRLVRQQVALLPEGPDEEERRRDRHVVLLQIDDGFGRLLIDWRIETPDPYDFTADCVLGVVDRLVADPKAARALGGWRTPAEVFGLDGPVPNPDVSALLRGKCTVVQRAGGADRNVFDLAP